MSGCEKEVLKANHMFYQAFAHSDFNLMTKCWSSSEKISVSHPGSKAIHGRKAVLMSWQMILKDSGGKGIQYHNPRVYLFGGFAYVICIETVNHIQLTSTNIFIHENETWRIVHHHAAVNNETIDNDEDFAQSIH